MLLYWIHMKLLLMEYRLKMKSMTHRRLNSLTSIVGKGCAASIPKASDWWWCSPNTGIVCARQRPIVIVNATGGEFTVKTYAPPTEISILPQASEALNKYKKGQKFVISPLHLTCSHVNGQHGACQQISPPFNPTEHVSGDQVINHVRKSAAFNFQIAPSFQKLS